VILFAWPWRPRARPSRIDSLSEVTRPTLVAVEGRVATPNRVTSPYSGLRAAVITWAFFETGPLFGSVCYKGARSLVSGVLSGGLAIECAGGLLHVGVDGAQFRLGSEGDIGEIIDRRLPPELARLLPERTLGELSYRECSLCLGDRVRVHAVVAPAASGDGPYRGCAAHGYTALPERGLVVVEDLSVAGV